MALSDVDVNSSALGLVYNPDNLSYYICGNFTTVVGANGSFDRSKAAAFDSNGNILPWNIPFTGAHALVSVLKDSNSTNLYFAGSCYLSGVRYGNMFEVSPNGTGIVVNIASPFTGTVAGQGAPALILTATMDVNYIYLGGVWGGISGVAGGINGGVTRLIRGTTNIDTSWTGNIALTPSNSIASLLVANNQLYVGGSYTKYNSTVFRSGLCSFDLISGNLTSFNPGMVSSFGTSTVVNKMSWDPINSHLNVVGLISGTLINPNFPNTGLCAFDVNNNPINIQTNIVSSNGVGSIVNILYNGNSSVLSGAIKSMNGVGINHVANFNSSDYSYSAPFNYTWAYPYSGNSINVLMVDANANTVWLNGYLVTLSNGVMHTGIVGLPMYAPPSPPPGPNASQTAFNTTLQTIAPGTLSPVNNYMLGAATNVVSDTSRYPNSNTFLENVNNQYLI